MEAIPRQEDIHSVYRRSRYVVGIGHFVFRHSAIRKQRRRKSVNVRCGAIKFLSPRKDFKTQLRLLVVTTRRFRKDMFGNVYLASRCGFRPPFARPCLLDGVIRITGWS